MKIGATLQIVSFETGTGCNLATLHPQCPVSLGMERYQHLNTARRLRHGDICDLMVALYHDHDFRGWVNFSHYNEPMMTLDVLVGLAHAIAVIAPESPRMVITNGAYLPDDPEPLRIFTEVHITDYGGALSPPANRLEALQTVTAVRYNSGKLDKRMVGPGPDRSHKACVYPFSDLTIDAFGNLRLCCFDWEGLASPGNVFRDGLDACLTQWAKTVRAISGKHMTAEAPDVCRHCRHAHFQTLARTHPAARHAAKVWLRAAHSETA